MHCHSFAHFWGSCRDRVPFNALAGLLIGIGSILLPVSSAQALEEVRLSYRGFQFGKLMMNDLATFAATGEASPNLRAMLAVIKVDEAEARAALTTAVDVDGVLLDEASQTFVGESFFQLVGSPVRVPNADTEPSWQYLRRAVVTSATDNQVNAIEVLQAIPADVIVVDTEKVNSVIQQLQADSSTIEAFLAEGFLPETEAAQE